MSTFTFDVELLVADSQNTLRALKYTMSRTRASLRSLSVEAESIADAWVKAKSILEQHDAQTLENEMAS